MSPTNQHFNLNFTRSRAILLIGQKLSQLDHYHVLQEQPGKLSNKTIKSKDEIQHGEERVPEKTVLYTTKDKDKSPLHFSSNKMVLGPFFHTLLKWRSNIKTKPQFLSFH